MICIDENLKVISYVYDFLQKERPIASPFNMVTTDKWSL